jgi:thiamine-phosphate pyrophosphorylase
MENARIIDANLNRASEALRVIEEVARFYMDDPDLTESFKIIRHKINNNLTDNYLDLLKARDSEADIGPQIANTSTRKELSDILKANFKRCQQALRVLEEYMQFDKSLDSNVFQSARYELYTLEKKMNLKAQKIYKNKRLENRKLYLVTDRSKFIDENAFLDAILLAIRGGVDIIQLREKTATAKEFIYLAKKIRTLCAEYDVLFIVNDRVDIAYAVNADGVHLGQDDMDIQNARKILGEQAIIGNSTHKPEDAINAMKNGADYAGVGPVFATPTKPGRQAVGIEYVQWAAQNINIPFFAIGGIDENNIEEVINAGATRVAVVRAIMNAHNPEETARKMLDKLSLARSVL